MRNLALYLVPVLFLSLVGKAFCHQGLISVQSNCGITAQNSSSGRITSPNYPSNYGNYQNCYWLITSNAGIIHLLFESFSLENCCDYVRVYDGNSSSSSKLLGEFNGNTLPPDLWSSSNQMNITFTTDRSATYRGFSAVYQDDTCGNYTELSSANRSSYHITNSYHCDRDDLANGWYRFTGAAGSQIATSCVPYRRCGAYYSGWMSGSHPTEDDGIVTRRVCYNGGWRCCEYSNYIRVKSCGSFYVYELDRPPYCNMRYCGNGTGHDYCVSSPCYNGGTCRSSHYGYYCSCPYGYSGSQCENRMRCDNSTCRNNGTCHNTYYGYHCHCPQGYSGRHCETGICNYYTCRNGGTCQDTPTGYNCTCPYGYTGQRCELLEACGNYTELSSATRSRYFTRNIYYCDYYDLTKGWYRFTGAAGSQIATSCVPNDRCGTNAPGWMSGSHPTEDDGIVTRQVCYNRRWNLCCYYSNYIRVKNCGSFYVYELDRTPTCNLRYCGNGTVYDYCASWPCNNGGTCQNTPGGYNCNCPHGYSGSRCETRMCTYYTCRNGGTCQNTPTGYNCTCPPRYTGQHCESLDYCDSSPCYNGGTCRSTRYWYYCSCPYGYSGSQCENRMCDYNTCRNGGTCRNRYYGYRCYCPQGYSGRHCETSVGCYNNNPCRNGGTCHHTYYGYIYCSCPRGYSGQHCETNLKTKVTCDTRYMEVELRRAFFPNLEWRNLHLSDPACRATRVTWSTIRLRTTLDGCGTNHTESNDMLEFSNEVKDDKSHLSLNQSVITRDSNTLLRFHCKYSRRQLVSTSFSPSKQTVHVSEGNFGNFTFTMNLFKSAMYNNMYLPFEYPVVVSLNQPLWIQFKVTDATTADLVVLADYCHATTSTNPNSFPRHEFVRSGCALDSTMAYNYDPTSSVQDFSIKSFRFIHTSNKLVYLHCELMACHRNSTNSRCSRGCVSSRRRRRAAEDEEDTSEAYDLSVGPFLGQSSGNGNSKATDDTKQTNAAMATGLGVVGSLLVLVCAVLVATKLYPWYKTRCSSPDVTVNSYENGSPADIDEKHEACEMQVKT